MRLIAYNMGQGGSKNPALRARLLHSLNADLFFVQESRDPAQYWLPAMQAAVDAGPATCLWTPIPGRRWGSGLWLKNGRLTSLPAPDDYTGRVIAALVGGLGYPVPGAVQPGPPFVALSIHVPAPRGSSYVKEVGHILDFARDLASGLPLVLAGDFNVAVGLRQPDHSPVVSRGEQALLQRLRDEFDLIPCWQTAHPGEALARTLRWMRRLDSLPYHCDGIFVPSSWASALRSCTVLENEEWSAISDHNPVVATFATEHS